MIWIQNCISSNKKHQINNRQYTVQFVITWKQVSKDEAWLGNYSSVGDGKMATLLDCRLWKLRKNK